MTSPLRRQTERGFVSIKVRAEATRGKPHSAIIIGMTILAGVMSPQQTYAVDVDPGDYIALPAGTNLALQYLQFSHDNSYWSPTTGRVGGRLDSEIGLFRFVHYTKLFGFTIDPQFIIPFGTINNVRIGKGSLNSSIGVGDPIVGSTFWAVNKPDTQTYLGITPLLTIPVGTYSSRKSINIGNNRWSGDLQVGFQTAFAKTGQPGKIRLQIWGDGYFYGNNNRYSGHNTLSQNNVWQLQTWISYDLDKTQNFSAGMDAVWGGKAYVDNIKGAGSRRTAIRFEYQKFFARRFQIVGEATHDVVSAGGFRQKIGINARMLYAF